jgi:hypothetical protein
MGFMAKRMSYTRWSDREQNNMGKNGPCVLMKLLEKYSDLAISLIVSVLRPRAGSFELTTLQNKQMKICIKSIFYGLFF